MKQKIYEVLIMFKEKPSISNRQNDDFSNILKFYYWFIFQCQNNIIIVFIISIIPKVFTMYKL